MAANPKHKPHYKHRLSQEDFDFLLSISATYPDVIDLDKSKPLAIGFFQQLLAVYPAAEESLKSILRFYCRRTQYLTSVAAGGFRINLDGSHAAEILPTEQADASAALAGLLAKRAARQQAARAAANVARKQTKAKAGEGEG